MIYETAPQNIAETLLYVSAIFWDAVSYIMCQEVFNHFWPVDLSTPII